MKRLAIIFIFINVCHYVKSQSEQSFDLSKDCNRSVNDILPTGATITTPALNSSTFKFYINGSCSGTLVNRYVNNSELGYYFLTAKHCISDNEENQPIEFMFNYQSPTGNSMDTPPSNRGNRNLNEGYQSNLFDNNPFNDDGNEYYHRSLVRKIEDFWYGDLALYEILTPIPPHFNVSYAGWNPSAFIPTYVPLPCIPQIGARFDGIHHPRGDIKKVSGVNEILNNYTPLSIGCYSVTSVVDFLFSWIWGNTASTQVICSYVDIPWMIVPLWCYGIVENGSSGSGLFNENQRLIGTMSGDPWSGCIIRGPSTYGTFHSKYPHASIKNTLNPGHSQHVDLFGLPARKINCYNYLELPGAPEVSGEYFPAKHYQADNKIILKSATDIDVTQPVIIYPEADYEFHAAGIITLDGNMDIKEGAEFETFFAPCVQQRIANPNTEAITKLSRIHIPSKTQTKKIAFDIEPHLILMPNPASNIVNIKLTNLPKNTFIHSIKVISLTGHDLISEEIHSQTNESNWIFTLDISKIPFGIYFIIVNTNDKIHSQKLIVR